LRYYRTRHLVFAGTVALTSAILCAALLTGESLQQGLLRDLHARLGAVRSAVSLSEGLFPAALARRMPDTQAALLLKGELLTAAGALCANDAQIIGVAPGSDLSRPQTEGGGWLSAVPNSRAREVLPDGERALRFEKPSLFSAELPLGAVKEARMVRRAVQFAECPAASDNLLTSDFALRPASVPPVNVQVPYAQLAGQAGVPGQANLLVSSRPPEEFERDLSKALTPEDAGLVLEMTNGATVVKSQRVFLPQAVTEALAAAGLKAELATFHLADRFEAGNNETPDGVTTNGSAKKETPYGFVAALTPDGVWVPRDLKDDEIVVNAWLAETLGVSTNDTVTLGWRRFEAGGRLVSDTRAFRVRGVLSMDAAAAAKRSMPVFPGMAKVDSCAAWDVGLPMDAAKLNDPANEAYWKQWRETPKAFLTFAAGKACFGTFFGEAMSVRVAADEATVRRTLGSLTPAQAGFVVRPVWAEGLKAARGSTDFRMLFAGMAFVLMAAALLLSGLTLSLGLETRKSEVALFSALGWARGKVIRMLAAEWSVPLLLGALVGSVLGAVLARALVWSMACFWRDAFAGASMRFHFSLPVACWAAGASAVLTLGVLMRALSRFSRCSPVALWQGEGREACGGPRAADSGRRKTWESLLGGALAVAALTIMFVSPGGAAENGAFFGAGFLLMLSLLLFVKRAAMACHAGREVTGPVRAGVSRALQSPRRSAPVVILLAVGIFLTVGIVSMKHDPAAGCERSSSGSG